MRSFVGGRVVPWREKPTLVLLLLETLVQHLDRSLDTRRLTSDGHELQAGAARSAPSKSLRKPLSKKEEKKGARESAAPSRSDHLPEPPRPVR